MYVFIHYTQYAIVCIQHFETYRLVTSMHTFVIYILYYIACFNKLWGSLGVKVRRIIWHHPYTDSQFLQCTRKVYYVTFVLCSAPRPNPPQTYTLTQHTFIDLDINRYIFMYPLNFVKVLFTISYASYPPCY